MHNWTLNVGRVYLSNFVLLWAETSRHKIEIKIGDSLITKYGMQVPSYDEQKVKNYMLGDDIIFDVNLNLGKGKFTAYTCDFNAEYISINADYRS